MNKRIFRIIPAMVFALIFCSPPARKNADETIAADDRRSFRSVDRDPDPPSHPHGQHPVGESRRTVRALSTTIRVAGEVMFNLKRQAHVTARTEGRIEQVMSYPGDKIRAARSCFPCTAANSFHCRRNSSRPWTAPGGSGRWDREPSGTGASQFGPQPAPAADVSPAELSRTESSGQLKPLLSVHAPIAGNVIESPVNPVTAWNWARACSTLPIFPMSGWISTCSRRTWPMSPRAVRS